MSSAVKDTKLPLPSGWVVYPSKSHLDKVYYFNVCTGVSSWERPISKQCYRSNGEKYSEKSSDLVAKSSSSSLGKSLHECKLTSATDKRLESVSSNSGILPNKSHVLQVTVAKECDSHKKKYNRTLKSRISANDKICVNEASVECEFQHGRPAHDEVLSRKRKKKKKKKKKRCSGSVELDSDSDIEKPPLRKIKLNNNVICQSGSAVDKLHSNKLSSQLVLPSAVRGSLSSALCASKSNLRNDDVQQALKAKTPNKISPDRAAVNAELESTGRWKYAQGLASKRLRALQTKLADELVRKENSEELGKCKTSKHSDILQKKLKFECNFGRKEVVNVERDNLRSKNLNTPGAYGGGFDKCKAAKRLEILQKKLKLEQKVGHKQQDRLLIKNERVPEACSAGVWSKERSPSSDASLVRDGRRFSDKTVKQNLSEQHPYVTAEVTNQEDELMEWEPIEDEKILSHIQEVRSQIHQGRNIDQDGRGIQTLDYDINSIFCADGKPEWFIVIDTNVLISSLNYIEELRDTNFKGLGFPVLVIPWQVLQELDVMKDKRGNVRSPFLTMRARKAVSFLLSNFSSKHPRIRGQTALDAVPKDFKIEVPDDSILQCCLQIARRTNQVILLSNDKNLCNKAIVNGIKSYQKAEMQQTLEELSSESEDQIQIQSLSGNDLSVANVGVLAAVESGSPAEVASVVDFILCKLKSLLKELLSRILENEMNKAYGSSWKIIVLVKPPWTLSDMIICFLKHWIAVFSIVLPAEVKGILECLKEFFDDAKQNKGYGHSLRDVKKMLQTSLHLCMAVQFDEYRDLVSACVSNIERLRKHCEETLTGFKKEDEKEKFKCDQYKSQNENVKTVMDVLKNCLELVQSFCALMCDVLGWEHHVVYSRPEPLPTVDIVQNRVQYIYPMVDALIKNIASILEHPVSALTVDHEAVKNLYLTLANFVESQEVAEKITPELILNFSTTESTRSTLEMTKTMFEEIELVLNRGINYFVQCGIA
ncbi:transcriptional protein SWT1 isoform X2 [Zootermopsis nevadensis]|uniref:transcriptional protein SWT1 isoform X2 n=1 Tax=Zootermopsis nevadensis TaxID=136037 RepID=UPI000B8EBFBF|nr:transcriptional protein SWT1 isoform X2 [Zootermopsis nevadensis]